MKLVIASSLAAMASAAGWGYDTQPWTSGYCKPADYVRQSPIDIISDSAKTENVAMDTAIYASSFVADNFAGAHAVKVNDVSSSNTHSITFSFDTEIGDDTYKCPQFHCHFADSEHSIDGARAFGECHVVCYNFATYGSFANSLNTINGDELAVFGFFMEEDAAASDNAALAGWINAYQNFNASTYTTNSFDVQIAVPDDTSKYYRYEGGLTTPGCNPIVQWTVFANPVKISSAQKLEILSWSSGHLVGNNRAVQPMQGREVTCFGCSSAAAIATSMMAMLAYFLH